MLTPPLQPTPISWVLGVQEVIDNKITLASYSMLDNPLLKRDIGLSKRLIVYISHLYMGLHVRPSPVPMGYVEHGDRVPLILGVSISLLFLTLFTVALRFYSRISITKRLYRDDWAIMVATFLAAAFSVGICLLTTRIGVGHHSWRIKNGHFKHLRRSIYAFELLYPPAIFAIKCSLLLFYLRIAEVSTMRYMFRAMMGILVVTLVAFEIALALRCLPIDFEDTPPKNYICVNELWLYNANGIINILTDVIILIMPIPLVLRLRLNVREKVAVICLFGVGGAACAVSFFRLFTLRDLTYQEDVTWHIVDVAIWSQIEIELGIICACVPCIRAVFVRHRLHKLPFSFISRIQNRSTATTSTILNKRRLMGFKRPLTDSTWGTGVTESTVAKSMATRKSSKLASSLGTFGTRNMSLSFPRRLSQNAPLVDSPTHGYCASGAGVTQIPAACTCDTQGVHPVLAHNSNGGTLGGYADRAGSIGGLGNGSAWDLGHLPPLNEDLLFMDDPIDDMTASPSPPPMARRGTQTSDLEQGIFTNRYKLDDGGLEKYHSGLHVLPPVPGHGSDARSRGDLQPHTARWTMSSAPSDSERSSPEAGEEQRHRQGSEDSLRLTPALILPGSAVRLVRSALTRPKVNEHDVAEREQAIRPMRSASGSSELSGEVDSERRDNFGNPMKSSPEAKGPSPLNPADSKDS